MGLIASTFSKIGDWYTAVKILDSFMSKKVVQKEDLQLVGATACLIGIVMILVQNFMIRCMGCASVGADRSGCN